MDTNSHNTSNKMGFNILKFLVLFAAATLAFSISEAVVGKSSQIRSYTILEGDNLLVICNETDRIGLQIYWSKNDSESTFMQSGRRLEITNINRSYSGNFTCHALNTSFPVSEYNETDANRTVEVIHVDVQYPTEIDNFSIEPNYVLENEPFNITCSIQGSPDPTWSIRNRNTGRRYTGASVHANVIFRREARCDDMGYLECTGSNRLNNGQNVTMGHNFTVYCSPRPQAKQNQYVVQARVGQYAILAMYVQAYPKANYTWSKDDGTDISSQAKQDDFEKETLLTFPTMTVPYFGNYTLKMQNEHGSYSAHYQIVAYGPPETPTNLKFSNVTYNSVTLRWTSGFDMGSRQHFIVMKLFGNAYSQLSRWIFDNSTNHGINQTCTYTLSGLFSNTTYNITLVAENGKGFTSPFSKPLISFRTKEYPKGKESPHTDVKLIVGLSLGTVATIGMLAFMAYTVRMRKQAAYRMMKV